VSGKRKRPGRKFDPPAGKAPRGGSKIPSYGEMQFCWRTVGTDCAGPFGWQNANHDLLFGHIIPKLHEFETMLWRELEGGAHHSCEVTGMSYEAQRRLIDIGRDDCDTLFSLRLAGRQRVWGIRERQVLNLLWWDPEHRVYPSGKKHT
jgi:hypothetical protein